jgi:hypothetical protein
MRVLFLGAGASAAAGYPLASGLLPGIEAMVKAERSVPTCKPIGIVEALWRSRSAAGSSSRRPH